MRLLKFSGIIVILIGVIILAIHFFTQPDSNTLLAVAAIVMIVGLALHIVVRKSL
ncbi:MAG: hypothetical protein LBV75_01630 [Paludibacter sp.]|jgi:drug/metabolite transporter (DMT)-like permease|nr:hypothetical protein [Paludibacter sp.]